MFEKVAQKLGLSVAVVRAVALVESSGTGFLDDGRPVIRFEPHIFSAKTGGKFDRSHPALSNPVFSSQRFGRWKEYEAALTLDATAAMLSTSWGMFQIMGFNFKACGFASVSEFVLAHKKSPQAQLDAWAAFIQNSGLVAPLLRRDWKEFASRYNGAGYAVNHYDTRIAETVAKIEKGEL